MCILQAITKLEERTDFERVCSCTKYSTSFPNVYNLYSTLVLPLTSPRLLELQKFERCPRKIETVIVKIIPALFVIIVLTHQWMLFEVKLKLSNFDSYASLCIPVGRRLSKRMVGSNPCSSLNFVLLYPVGGGAEVAKAS